VDEMLPCGASSFFRGKARREAMWSEAGPLDFEKTSPPTLIGPLERVSPLAIYPTGQAGAASNTFPIPAVRVPSQERQWRPTALDGNPTLYHVQIPKRVPPDLQKRHAFAALRRAGEALLGTSRFPRGNSWVLGNNRTPSAGEPQGSRLQAQVSRSTSNLCCSSSPTPSTSPSQAAFCLTKRPTAGRFAIPNDRAESTAEREENTPQCVISVGCCSQPSLPKDPQTASPTTSTSATCD
jgi:hypothetical protein